MCASFFSTVSTGSLSLSIDRLLDGFDCVHEDDPNQQQPVETISHHTANLNLRGWF